MRTLLTIAAMAGALALAPEARARLAEDPKPAQPMEVEPKAQAELVIPAEELVVEYYRPKRMHPKELLNKAHGMFENSIQVRTARIPGMESRVVSHQAAISFNEMVLVRGSREQVDAILAYLRKLEQGLEAPADEASGPSRPELVDFEYAVRFVDPQTLDLALERFKGAIRLRPADAGWVTIPNITTLPEHGLILVKEAPERVLEIKAFLERLDTPAPQVTVSYLVLQGATEADPGTPALPAELTSNLKRLVPFQHFRLLSSGVLRGSSRAPMNVQVDQVDGSPSMRLELEPASFDAASKTLTLRRCHFQLSSTTGQRMLETGAALRAGEYTVIGAAGRDALFLVLRLTLE